MYATPPPTPTPTASGMPTTKPPVSVPDYQSLLLQSFAIYHLTLLSLDFPQPTPGAKPLTSANLSQFNNEDGGGTLKAWLEQDAAQEGVVVYCRRAS
jgi:hypothetical protein